MKLVYRVAPWLILLTAIGLLAPRLYLWIDPPISESVQFDADCRLQTGCVVQFAAGSLSLVMPFEGDYQVLKNIPIQLDLEGISAEAIWMDFSGVEMDMGFNRVILNQDSPQQFTGMIQLPSCYVEDMTWLGEVIILNEGNNRIATFNIGTHFEQ